MSIRTDKRGIQILGGVVVVGREIGDIHGGIVAQFAPGSYVSFVAEKLCRQKHTGRILYTLHSTCWIKLLQKFHSSGTQEDGSLAPNRVANPRS
jgi:hypothetical protein